MNGRGATKKEHLNHHVFFGAAWSGTAARKAKSVPKSLKSRSAGVWKAFLGVSWTPWWQVFGEMCAKIAPRGAKMSPRGAKIRQLDAMLEESCGQEAPRSTQERLLGAMLGASWPIWGAFLGHLAEKAAKQKTLKNLRLSKVFATLGVSRWGS